MRFLIVPFVLLLAVLAACGGGGSSSSSTTPTATPTPSPAPVPCTASHLYGALVSTDVLDGPVLSIGITNTLVGCTLPGPPAINWYDTAGAKLDVMPASSVRCQPRAGDYSTCVFDDAVTLQAGAPTPAEGVNGQALAVVTIADVATFAPCPAPNVKAHFIGLEFPGITPDLQIELSADVELLTCVAQVTLQGYGPLATGGDETPVSTDTPSAS